MAKKINKSLDQLRRRASGTETDPAGSAADKREHQEHLKRLKKYKKKRRQQIIGLVLECLFLLVLIGVYMGVNYASQISQRINARVTDPVTTPAEETLPQAGPDFSASPKDESNPGESSSVLESPDETLPSIQVDLPDRNGFYTFAIFGVDARDQSIMGKGVRSDVCMIVTINKESGEINLSSVYRDYALETSEGKYRKLTDSYSINGPEAMVDILNWNLDLPISDFVVINWTAMADIVDIMGGLEVELTLKEATECNKYIEDVQDFTGRPQGTKWVEEKEGLQLLNGISVVAFCRLRYGMGDDFGRTERQRYVVSLLVEKAKSQNIFKIKEMVDKVTENMKTTLSFEQLLGLAMDYKKYHLAEKGALPRNQVSDASVRYVMYATDLEEEIRKLHELLYNDPSYTPSETVRRIAAYHAEMIAAGKSGE